VRIGLYSCFMQWLWEMCLHLLPRVSQTRPLIINDVLKQADAFIAAWLPGTEGQGVADVLFGDYKPTGKLSFTWPHSIADIPVKMGDKNYNPLFPYGYGLTY
jgi:beta-glucosidase